MTSEPRTRPLSGTVRETATLALPFLLSSIAAAINQLTDRLFLSQASSAAIEAVLPAGMLSVVITNVAAAAIGYSATFVARYHGGGQERAAARAFVQGLYLTAFAVPLFFLAVPAGCAVLELAGHSPEVLAAEKTYFSLCQPAGALSVLAAVLGGLFTGQGHTKYVGFCAIAGALANILFDRLLILGGLGIPALGLRGAGLSTVFAATVPCLLLAARALRDPLLRQFPLRETWAFSPSETGRILRLGTPEGVYVLVGSGTFTVFTLLLGRLGPAPLAVSNVVFAINNIYYLTVVALAQAVTILVARNLGRGDGAAVRRSSRSGLLLAGFALVVFFAAILPFGEFWLGFFRSPSIHPDDFVRIGKALLLVLLLREIAEGGLSILVGALRGTGDTRFMMLAKSGIELFVWMPLVVLVVHFAPSLVLLWLTMPLCLGISAIILFIRWQTSKVQG